MVGFLESENGWNWGFTGGAEFGVADFTITPYISWNRDQESKESGWVGGVNGHYWISETMGVGLGYSMSEGPNRAHTILATIGFRY